MIDRRQLLAWLSRGIGAGCAAVVAIPGLSYLLAPLRRRAAKATVQRVVELDRLPVGKPFAVPVVGSRQDAWVHYDQEVIGRVWLLRRSDDAVPPEQAEVVAFSAVCPHVGCIIQLDSGRQRFVCPCHRAQFQLSGEPVPSSELGFQNPAPRGMDQLECRLVQDEATSSWWVEVKYEKFEYGLARKVAKA